MKKDSIISLLLRVGIAFSFLYAAVQSFRDPTSWIGFLPIWLEDAVAPFMGLEMVLMVFSVVEIIVAVWILSGWRGTLSGLVAAGMIGGIVGTNLGALDILFRDIPIFFAALAYALFSSRRN